MEQLFKHRDKMFKYTQEAEQDMKSQYGLDITVFAEATIDSLLDMGTVFDSIQINAVRTDDGQIVLTGKPAEKKSDITKSTNVDQIVKGDE